jgi:uncharacterized coiled-coil protein SlyX
MIHSLNTARLGFFPIAASMAFGSAAAQDNTVEDNLRRQVAEQKAEIATLRQRLESLTSQRPARPPDAGGKTTNEASPTAAQTTPAAIGNSKYDDQELATALESSLIRQGAAVLSPGTFEIEPELSYFYDESAGKRRRDAFGTAISARFGLPKAMQMGVYLPYVIKDRIAGGGSASGIGDVYLSLTKEVRRESAEGPALLIFGNWRTTTGDISSNPPTGFGQHAIRLGLTATKRMDPALLMGSVSYTTNRGTARLPNGARLKSGDVFGVRLGSYLAATPETSFYWGISYNSSGADRFNDERVVLTDRARGVLELGSTTIVGRGRFFNLGIGIGVTPAAPRLALTMSLPFRF